MTDGVADRSDRDALERRIARLERTVAFGAYGRCYAPLAIGTVHAVHLSRSAGNGRPVRA